ncbi:MAG: prephenate dehydrogenase/arogenate dehydrogenase family protein [Methylotetracoccus sp.]|jgi:prephenate dehydrogenase|nr:prephenate dehydrogenase/arogenate dehydrogenase family protein [Methylotetracoccus sp.]
MMRRLCVVGLGLIGGSVARAARDRALAAEIVGADMNPATLAKAVELGIIDQGSEDIAAIAADSDFVVIAVPVGAFGMVLRKLSDVWSLEAVYTDVGSTKADALAAARRCFGSMPRNFIPGHPIAGAEQSGVAASSADLYLNKRVILTPSAECDPARVDQVDAFWTTIGAKVSRMDAEHHDAVLAATSHLPHVLAYALVHLLGRKDEQTEIFQYAAGGFRDFSRIASSDPTMWRDICLANREHLLTLIGEFQSELTSLADLLRSGQDQELFEFLVAARTARQRYLTRMEG